MNFTVRTITVFTLFVFLILRVSAVQGGNVRVKGADVPESFRLHSYPRPAPAAFFADEKGERRSLQDFRGKVLLVNIWSTACAQCVIELPMLDRLQKDMGGLKFEVLTLSSGTETPSAVRAFWTRRGIKNLKAYSDLNAAFSMAADIRGLPTTLLIDGEGRELGRLRGMAEWDGPVIKAQIREIIRREKQKAAETASAAGNENRADSSEPMPPPENNISNWFRK